MIKKVIALNILSVLVLSGIIVPLKKAEAIIPGLPSIVHDPIHTGETIGKWAWDQRNRIFDELRAVALETLKKRVLDRIVNQTIGWINGDGDPQFITDFGGFIKDAGDRAVGDVLQEINLGDMCQPFRLRLQFDLQRTYFGESPFNTQTSCSLSRVVDNIEGFYDDFRRGGWVGYTEMLRPQNNYYGSYLLAEDEILRRQSVAVSVAGQEIASAGGFRNQKRCYEWVGVFENREELITGTGRVRTITRPVNAEFNFPNPNNPPEDGTLGADNWQCSRSEITTPGQLIAGAANTAVNAHTNYAINVQTFRDYAAAIIDSGINRLIREGVNGFINIITDRSSPSYTDYSRGALDKDAEDAGDAYTGGNSAQDQSYRNDLNRNASSLNQTRSLLVNALNSLTPFLDSNISFQVWCDTSSASGLNRDLHPQTCSSYTSASITSLRAEIDGLRTALTQLVADIDTLKTDINTLLSSSSGTSSQIANLIRRSGDLINEGTRQGTSVLSRLSDTQTSLNQCQTGTAGQCL